MKERNEKQANRESWGDSFFRQLRVVVEGSKNNTDPWDVLVVEVEDYREDPTEPLSPLDYLANTLAEIKELEEKRREFIRYADSLE